MSLAGLVNIRSLFRVGFIWRVSVVVILALVWSVAYAGDARIVYYDVTGNTAKALRNELDAKGPLDETGKRFDAHTEWRVAWRYRYQAKASGCGFTEMKISVNGTIVLPHWVHTEDVSNSLVQKWQRYVAALHLHEEGHYAHGTSAAKDITALVRSFHDYSGDCAAMVRSFNDQANSIIDKYKSMDATYDRATDHGRSQGAQFP